MKSHGSRSNGYLMTEVVILSLIVAAVLLGVLKEAASAVRGNRIADQQATGTALAQAKIEDLERQLFAAVANGSDASTLRADGSPGGIFSRSWQVISQTTNGAPAKQISVTVSWPEVNGTPQVTLTTLIADIPPYGPGFPTVVERSWRRS